MGILDIFKAKKSYKGRGRNWSPADREKMMRVRDLTKLRKENPDLYWNIRMKELFGPNVGEKSLSFDDIERVIKMLGTLNLKVVPKSAPGEVMESSGVVGMFERFFNSSAGERLAETIGGAAIEIMRPPVPEREPARQSERIQTREPAQLEEPEQEREVEPVATQVQMFINELQGKTPDQAAELLLSVGRVNKPVDGLIKDLVRVPEESLAGYVKELGRMNPDYRPLIEWFESNWPWFTSTVDRLKVLSGAGISVPARNGKHSGL